MLFNRTIAAGAGLHSRHGRGGQQSQRRTKARGRHLRDRLTSAALLLRDFGALPELGRPAGGGFRPVRYLRQLPANRGPVPDRQRREQTLSSRAAHLSPGPPISVK